MYNCNDSALCVGVGVGVCVGVGCEGRGSGCVRAHACMCYHITYFCVLKCKKPFIMGHVCACN